MSDPDLRVITCNVIKANTNHTWHDGARAYLRYNTGADRIAMLVRSRSGRYIKTWVAYANLANWRVRTVPPEHPRYAMLADLAWHDDDEDRLAAKVAELSRHSEAFRAEAGLRFEAQARERTRISNEPTGNLPDATAGLGL